MTILIAVILLTVFASPTPGCGDSDPRYLDAISDGDPLSQGRKMTCLIGTYLRAIEDLRIRRARIVEHLAESKHMTHADIASALGLSAGRITQIRQGRAFLRPLEGEEDVAGQ